MEKQASQAKEEADRIEAESKWLPIPAVVQAWIDGTVDDCDDSKEANKETVEWLKHALDGASGTDSSLLKKAAQKLLAVRGFTQNLEYMDLFDDLQSHCRTTLLQYCKPLQQYFVEAELGPYFSHNVIPMHSDLDSKTQVRQDHPLIGLQLPDDALQLDAYTYESVYIHFLRLVAMAVNPLFQDQAQAIATKNQGVLKECKIKGDVRIRNKAVADHRSERRPRPAMNIDVVRNAITFQTKEDLAAAAKALSTTMGGALRVKNGCGLLCVLFDTCAGILTRV